MRTHQLTNRCMFQRICFVCSIVYFAMSVRADTLSNQPLEDSLRSDLRSTLSKVPALGGVIAVRLADGEELTLAEGLVGVGEATLPDSRFRIWSISKTFTAAVVMQLIDEGKLSLDDTIDSWNDEIANNDQITIRHLLSHTSGISDYFVAPEVMAAWDKPWTVKEMLSVAAAHSPDFEPGEKYGYSNSNFVLLGHIIEQVTNDSLAHQLRSRLFEPLRLANTFEERDELIPGGFSPGFEHVDGANFRDVTKLVHPTVTWATGSLVSTAGDLRSWCEALVSGQVVSEEFTMLLQTPFALNDGSASPRGLVLSVSETSFGTIVGHGGGPLHGNTATMIWLREHDIIMTLVVNGTSPDAPRLIALTGWGSLLTPE